MRQVRDGARVGSVSLVVGVLAYAAFVAVLLMSGKRTLSKMKAFDPGITVIRSTLATI